MLVCRACGQENPDGFRFCGACASSLEPPVLSRTERKVITALFCDLVGSTAQAEQLDPEDVQALLARYHAGVAAEIERFGGTVEKFIGDAVVALFGVPVAHEDDAERAVRAALAIRGWVAEQPDVQVRVAINSGEALVVVGASPNHGEHLASGDVLNTAARLQSAAPVDGILVGEQTYWVTRRVIEYRSHEPVAAKGKSEPVPVWEVVQARSRLGDDLDDRPRRLLLGRERELGLLRDALQRSTRDETAQLVTLVGVPGIGKSRLVSELFQTVDAAPDLYWWRQGRSLPYGETQSFWALAEIVKAHAGVMESDSTDDARAKLALMLESALDDAEERRWVEGHVQPLVGIASVGEPGGDRRPEAFAAWRRFLEALAERRPLVLVFEDLHWADEALLDFIDHLADWVNTAPMLIVATARPELLERRPGWGGGKRNAATVSLGPLTDADTARLLANFLGQGLLPADVQAAVVSRVGGNPLFAEEYVRMLQDRGFLRRSGGGWTLQQVASLPLPESIQGTVAARIDALSGPEKELLRDGSVVGKVFWTSALTTIGELGRSDADQLLHALERKEFIRRERRSSVGGETQYAFLHALVRDVAYGQLARADRAAKHRAAAAWIEGQSPDRTEDRAEMLAHHLRAALALTRAVGGNDADLIAPTRAALISASDRAAALNAWAVARDLAVEALEMIEEDDPAGAELAVRIAWASFALGENDTGTATAASEGALRLADYERAAEAQAILSRMLWYRGEGEPGRAAAERAVELVAGRPASASKARALANLARRACLQGEDATALARGNEALAMANELGRDDYAAHVLNTIGMARVNTGDLGGLADIERSIALADSAGALDELLTGHNNLANTLWQVGRVDGSGDHLERYRETASRLGLASYIDWAECEMVYLAYLRGEHVEMIAAGERQLAAIRGKARYMEGPLRTCLAYGCAVSGDHARAIEYAEEAVSLTRATGDRQNVGAASCVLAVALWAAGRFEEASAFAAEVAVDPGTTVYQHWIFPLPLLFHELGRGGACLELARSLTTTRWSEAMVAVGNRDFLRAADVYRDIGAQFVSAWALLIAAERGELKGRPLEEPHAYFRRIGARPYARRCSALLPGDKRSVGRGQ